MDASVNRPKNLEGSEVTPQVEGAAEGKESIDHKARALIYDLIQANRGGEDINIQETVNKFREEFSPKELSEFVSKLNEEAKSDPELVKIVNKFSEEFEEAELKELDLEDPELEEALNKMVDTKTHSDEKLFTNEEVDKMVAGIGPEESKSKESIESIADTEAQLKELSEELRKAQNEAIQKQDPFITKTYEKLRDGYKDLSPENKDRLSVAGKYGLSALGGVGAALYLGLTASTGAVGGLAALAIHRYRQKSKEKLKLDPKSLNTPEGRQKAINSLREAIKKAEAEKNKPSLWNKLSNAVKSAKKSLEGPQKWRTIGLASLAGIGGSIVGLGALTGAGAYGLYKLGQKMA